MTPPAAGRAVLRLAHTSAWVRAVLALLAGVIGSFAQAPWDLSPLIFVPLVTGFLLPGSRPFLTGWLIGLGYFAPTLGWITEPFQIDAAAHGWMAPFAAAGMAAGLALFWGAAVALARWAGPSWTLVAFWPLAELARGYVLTGFPWAMPPQALVDVMAGQGLSLFGPHGMMLVLCLIAWLLSRPATGAARLLVLAGLAAATLALTLLLPMAGPSPLSGHIVRLIQPNAPQHEKWDPEKVQTFVRRQLEYTAAPGQRDLVIWPETALPYLLEYAEPVLEQAAVAADGAPVVLGIQRRAEGRFYNSLVALDATGAPEQVYDKHHLVPFGEYMPAAWFFRRVAIAGLAQRADGAFSPGMGAQLIDLGPIGTALPLICYEAVFAQDVNRAPSRPAMLLQITNDAWFGDVAGPQQHLAQARMRAIEQGLPMVRAANTGISAVIDPRGRVLGSLPLGSAGYLDASLPTPAAPTLYARTGDTPWAILLIVASVVLLLRRR